MTRASPLPGNLPLIGTVVVNSGTTLQFFNARTGELKATLAQCLPGSYMGPRSRRASDVLNAHGYRYSPATHSSCDRHGV